MRAAAQCCAMLRQQECNRGGRKSVVKRTALVLLWLGPVPCRVFPDGQSRAWLSGTRGWIPFQEGRSKQCEPSAGTQDNVTAHGTLGWAMTFEVWPGRRRLSRRRWQRLLPTTRPLRMILVIVSSCLSRARACLRWRRERRLLCAHKSASKSEVGCRLNDMCKQ